MLLRAGTLWNDPRMPDNWTDLAQRLALTYAVPFGLKILGSLALWIVGRALIDGVRRVFRRSLEARKVDATLIRYADSMASVMMTVLLLVGMLSLFGVETASFAGLLAGVGLAIGAAWSGLLSNFAAGVFMVVLRPFKVGDMVTAAGVTGVVHEIGLFATTIDTSDNIRTFIGNGKIFGDAIQNYTVNPYRRVELKAQLHHSVDPADAIAKLKEKLAKIPNVLKDPAPSVELADFTAAGPLLAVRPFCHNDHYWDVYFATNEAIAAVGAAAGYPVPETRVAQRTV
jgi:small conductance mechanosensitive channel